MELVYPIYLDRDMMNGFLASLEDGLISFSDLERRSKNSRENQKSIKLGIKISNFLSGIFGGGAEASLGQVKGTEAEEIYKGSVQYPDIALFIKLRDLLIKEKHLTLLSSKDDVLDINIGDIVEVQGSALSNPAFQVRNLFKQIEPLLNAVFETTRMELEQTKIRIEGAKYGESVNVQEEEIVVKNKKQKEALIRLVEVAKEVKQSEEESYKLMGKALSDLFPQDGLDTLAFQSNEMQSICRLYPELVRKGRVQDIYDAKWRCIGKVIDIIPASGEYDLLKGLPIGYFAGEQFSSVVEAFNNETVTLDFENAKIKGPAVVLATMAIFS